MNEVKSNNILTAGFLLYVFICRYNNHQTLDLGIEARANIILLQFAQGILCYNNLHPLCFDLFEFTVLNTFRLGTKRTSMRSMPRETS